VDNYAVLKSYGIDTTKAGDFKFCLTTPDGQKIEKVLGALGPAAAAMEQRPDGLDREITEE